MAWNQAVVVGNDVYGAGTADSVAEVLQAREEVPGITVNPTSLHVIPFSRKRDDGYELCFLVIWREDAE